MKIKNVRQIIKRQDLRNQKHKNENLRREDSTLQSERNSQTSDVLRRKILQLKCYEPFEESDRTVKNTYDTYRLFIGRKGVAPSNHLDIAVANFQ
jgi:hypothetical protein